MLRHDCWIGGDNLGKPALQRRGDTAVQLLTPAAQQGAVCRVLHQRVLEGVLSIGRRTAPEDQLGASELFEGFVQLLLRHSRDRADEFIGERTPERGGRAGRAPR